MSEAATDLWPPRSSEPVGKRWSSSRAGAARKTLALAACPAWSAQPPTPRANVPRPRTTDSCIVMSENGQPSCRQALQFGHDP